MTTLVISDAIAVAYALFDAGFKPCYSSSICESLTAGYGKLHEYGDWEYPLVLDSVDDTSITPWEVVKYSYVPIDLTTKKKGRKCQLSK